MKVSTVASVLVAAFAASSSFAEGEGIISVNLTKSGGNQVTGSELYGLKPAVGTSWYNVTETSGEDDPQHFTISVQNETRDGVAKSLANAVSVKFTTDASEKPFQRYQQDGIHGDDDAFMYNYLNDNGNITVDVANVPYKAYKVVVYLGADWAGNVGGWSLEGPDFNPIQINGTYYRYDSDLNSTVKCGTDAASCWGFYGSGTAEVGRNAIISPVQYGAPLRIYVPKCYKPRRSSLCAFQIVEAEGEMKPVPGAISVNFVDNKHEWNSDNPEGEPHKWRDTTVAQVGLVNDLSGGWLRAESWNNIEYKFGDPIVVGGTQKLKVWNGLDSSVVGTNDSEVTLTWSAGDTYFINSPVPEDNFLRGYLADGSEPSISVTGIPFEEYDLIVYLSADWGGDGGSRWLGPDFNPVKVNGVSYTWSAEKGKTVQGTDPWGEYAHVNAQLGVNALRIAGLKGSELSLSAGTSWKPRRGGIAAFQIVEPIGADIVAEGDITTKEINRLAKEGKAFSVEIPAGNKLILGKKPLVCSVLKVICKGDLVLDTDHELTEADETTLAKIDLSGVRGLVFHGWKPTARVISFNFNGDESRLMSAQGGFAGAFAGEEIPASSWNDISAGPKEGSITPWVWNGMKAQAEQIDGLTFAWTNGGSYQYGTSPDIFRRGWFSDWALTISGLPDDFGTYDIICYFNWDGLNEHFRSVLINGAYYAGGDDGIAFQTDNNDLQWGTTNKDDGSRRCSEPATLGINTFRLNNQTAKGISLSQGKEAWLRYLCAIQIVEHVKPRRYLNPLVFTIR